MLYLATNSTFVRGANNDYQGTFETEPSMNETKSNLPKWIAAALVVSAFLLIDFLTPRTFGPKDSSGNKLPD